MSEPNASAVHVDSPDWNARKKPKTAIAKRALEPLDSERSKTPFPYQGNVLGSLREDQVPRFFGALTDSDKLPAKTVKLSDLTAMQNRVDTAKVKAIAENGAQVGKLPVVVQHNGQNWIADGHHRLAAAWLNGDEDAEVRFKDLEPETNVMKDAGQFRVAKVDEGLGLVFGFAIVCKVNGEDYYDLNIDPSGERVPEHIPEDAMTKAALDLSGKGAPGNEMHKGPDRGHFPFMFPLTTDIAKSLGIQTEKTGLLVAYKPPADVLAKFRDGTYTGFSIEGGRVKSELVD